MGFVKANRERAFLKAIVQGPPGSGKSWTALELASWLVSGSYRGPDNAGRVAVIDSEGRAREYAGGTPFWFSLEEPESFGPDKWIAALQEARRLGFGVVILDSLSDEWRGRGGVLEQADQAKGEGVNSFRAWGPLKAAHWRLVEEILAFPGHVLITLRSKLEYSLEEVPGQRGKQVVCRGLAPITEDELPYRFPFIFELSTEGEAEAAGPVLRVRKSVAASLPVGSLWPRPGRDLAKKIEEWIGTPGSVVPSVFLSWRAKIAEASTKADLDVAAIGLRKAAAELTEREVARLREVFAARKAEFKE